jgi:hypothetical protein
MTTELTGSQEFSEHVPADALLTILAPVVRLLVRNGVLFDQAQFALTQMYLEQAVRHLESNDQPRTEARLRILTGIGRTKVNAFLTEAIPLSMLRNRPDEVYELANLLTAWVTDNRYLLPVIGSPRDLPIDAPIPHPSFLSLVKEFAPSFEPGVLLDELVRSGNVLLNEERTTVRFLKREYLSSADSPAQILRLVNGARNLMEILEHNGSSNATQQFFERSVQSNFPISPADANDFGSLLKVEGQKLLEKLDQWLSEREADHVTGVRPGANLFHYVAGGLNTAALSSHNQVNVSLSGTRPETKKEIDLLEGFLNAGSRDREIR